MLVVNSLRGIHSTGLFGVSKTYKEDESYIVKSVGSPYTLFDWTKTGEYFDKMLSKFCLSVGHGRYATQGDVVAENAHPFEAEGRITLVHNGVIRNFYSLKNFEKHKGIEVDSHLVAQLLAEKDPKEVLEGLEGAFALVWWDAQKETLHMARNKERPLAIAKLKGRNTLVFASEAATLSWNEERNGAALDWINELEPFKLLTFKRGSIKPLVEDFKPFVRPPVTYYKGESHREAGKSWKDKQREPPTVFHHLNGGVVIRTGEVLPFEVEDFEEVGNRGAGWLLLRGRNKTYPEVEFQGSWKGDETELYSAHVQCKGRVMSLYKIDPEKDPPLSPEIAWRAFLTDLSLVEENPDLTFRDATVLSEHRFTELLTNQKNNCGWCNHVIDARDPAKLSVSWDMTNKHDIILCESCSSYDVPEKQEV